MQIIYDGRKVQVWEFVFQGLNMGKWSTGKHCDGVAVAKKCETRYVPKRWHLSFKWNFTCFNISEKIVSPIVFHRRMLFALIRAAK